MNVAFARVNLVTKSVENRDSDIKRVFLIKAYQDFNFVGGYGVLSWENNGLTFTCEDLKGVSLQYHDPIVITIEFEELTSLVVDEGATANIFYANWWEQMNLNKNHFIENDAQSRDLMAISQLAKFSRRLTSWKGSLYWIFLDGFYNT